ncbi:MAG: HD domain-containing protein [Nitrospinae bacterium]|nr:HD domain-containing protein [Nitrospinota bacterium]
MDREERIRLKDRLLSEMEGYFQDDIKRIGHARKVTEFAEEINREINADYEVIIGAAVLHDIGIHMAEKKYNSNSGRYQEIEGPPIARRILKKLGLYEDIIEEICDIIGHHHSPRPQETTNFKVLNDADWLVNIEEEVITEDKERLKKIIEKVFFTETGKRKAYELYIE